MIQLAALLVRPLLGELPVSDAAKDRMAAVNTMLAGGSGEAWIGLARQQASLPIRRHVRYEATSAGHGGIDHDGKPLRWSQFAWSEQQVDDCAFHHVCCRFYQNGFISLELVASKDTADLDMRDLVGHSIELRDRSGFLIGIWSAAFAIVRGTDRAVFHASATDDFLPLKIHFPEMAGAQAGMAFRI